MHAERAGVSVKSFTSWNKTKISNSADLQKCMISEKAEQIDFNALLHSNATLWRIKHGEDVCFNRFCVHQTSTCKQLCPQSQTRSMKINVVGGPSCFHAFNQNKHCYVNMVHSKGKVKKRSKKTIEKYYTMQHVAVLSCFQSERTLLCKHSLFEGYKRRQPTAFLIRVTRS